ncbi:MAG TPA: NusA-like transcription termination signal-binding factor [Candidatus Nanoarchaeia archaeon]|nr:NusA-like transcription termination signal-binding factor [Candidatus Nanoarchaeia archaeon]
MNRIKYDSELIKLITLFESMTGAGVKDCIAGDNLTFIVEENEIGKAIGKGGANIKKLESALKKRIRVVEFSSDVLQFVRNLVYPVEVPEVKNDRGIITINGKDANTRAMLIGRNHQNLKHINDVAKRYFDVKEIKIV